MKKDTIYSDSLLPQTFEYIKSHNLFAINGADPKYITVYRPGFSGKSKATRDELRSKFVGNAWRTAFKWGNRVITYGDARTIYEDAYYEFLAKDPEGQKKLQWIIETACDVYDNSDSNILSEFNYEIQESRSTHLQDISIRRCVIMRFGKEFHGDHLVEIRGHNSEGYALNPGQVAFHLPHMILQPEFKDDWIKLGSIESFWQSNKVVQIQENAFESSKLKLTVHLMILATTNTNSQVVLAVKDENNPKLPKNLPFIDYPTLNGLSFINSANQQILQDKDFSAQLSKLNPVYNLSLIDNFVPVFVDPLVEDNALHILYYWRPKKLIEIDDKASKYNFYALQTILSSTTLSKSSKSLIKVFAKQI